MIRTVYDVRFLLVVVIVTVLVAILYPIKQNRTTNDRLLQTVNSTRQTQVDNTDTNRRIRDCVDPKGACYKANQARAAERARLTQETVLVTNACSVWVERNTPEGQSLELIERAVRQCVGARMAQEEKGTG